jgi:hypothetical protein
MIKDGIVILKKTMPLYHTTLKKMDFDKMTKPILYYMENYYHKEDPKRLNKFLKSQKHPNISPSENDTIVDLCCPDDTVYCKEQYAKVDAFKKLANGEILHDRNLPLNCNVIHECSFYDWGANGNEAIVIEFACEHDLILLDFTQYDKFDTDLNVRFKIFSNIHENIIFDGFICKEDTSYTICIKNPEYSLSPIFNIVTNVIDKKLLETNVKDNLEQHIKKQKDAFVDHFEGYKKITKENFFKKFDPTQCNSYDWYLIV